MAEHPGYVVDNATEAREFYDNSEYVVDANNGEASYLSGGGDSSGSKNREIPALYRQVP